MSENYEYAGFWIRFIASLVDSVLLMAIILPLSILLYGPAYLEGPDSPAMVLGLGDFLISYVMPFVAIICFWVAKGGTPGKLLFRMRIVRAVDGEPLSIGRAVGRYFAYIPSTLLFGIGYLWIAFDQRKQGWHDKIAGTYVLRSTSPSESAGEPQWK